MACEIVVSCLPTLRCLVVKSARCRRRSRTGAAGRPALRPLRRGKIGREVGRDYPPLVAFNRRLRFVAGNRFRARRPACAPSLRPRILDGFSFRSGRPVRPPEVGQRRSGRWVLGNAAGFDRCGAWPASAGQQLDFADADHVVISKDCKSRPLTSGRASAAMASSVSAPAIVMMCAARA